MDEVGGLGALPVPILGEVGVRGGRKCVCSVGNSDGERGTAVRGETVSYFGANVESEYGEERDRGAGGDACGACWWKLLGEWECQKGINLARKGVFNDDRETTPGNENDE